MEVIKTAIDGMVIIEPHIFNDSGEYLLESFSQKDFDEEVRPIVFVQDNESKFSYGVIQGLYCQKMSYIQSKSIGRLAQQITLRISQNNKIKTERRCDKMMAN